MGIERAGVRSTGRAGTPVLSVVNDDVTVANGSSLIDETVREGAWRMLAAAARSAVAAAPARKPTVKGSSKPVRRMPRPVA
jgi:hypothetical protein